MLPLSKWNVLAKSYDLEVERGRESEGEGEGGRSQIPHLRERGKNRLALI